MHRDNPSTLNSFPASRGLQDISFEQQTAEEEPDEADAAAAPDGESMLDRHRMKLAVGAAAMLGMAIFYKWREHRLAKEDPEEYARLQRLKQAVKNEERTPKAT